MSIGHAPVGLIADYAAGTLPPGMSLLVASHLSYCPACRDKAARLEALCGALLAEAEAVDPAPRCLAKALARIAKGEAAEPAQAEREDALPRPLCRKLAVPLCDLRWRTVMPGLSACRIGGFPAERVGLMRVAPGVCMHGEDFAATLVLSGRISGGGLSYDRGALAFGAAGEACGPETCLCLVVQPKITA